MITGPGFLLVGALTILIIADVIVIPWLSIWIAFSLVVIIGYGLEWWRNTNKGNSDIQR
ncbi:MAG: hypothetical protein IIB00_07970 [candidate division Zixibacteria bacterium]|nr:hypothetical protein [candidate division Zixibacteria bacterium]